MHLKVIQKFVITFKKLLEHLSYYLLLIKGGEINQWKKGYELQDLVLGIHIK